MTLENFIYDSLEEILNGNYDADPNELYAKNILLNNESALHLFKKDVILNAKNHHVGI